MAQKKKSFVRVDGSGRVIEGSNILRVTKPKFGNWLQIQGYECCDPFYPTTTSSTTSTTSSTTTTTTTTP